MSLLVNDRKCLGYPVASCSREDGIMSVPNSVGHTSINLGRAWEEPREYLMQWARAVYGTGGSTVMKMCRMT
jgi:hypothetical protein